MEWYGCVLQRKLTITTASDRRVSLRRKDLISCKRHQKAALFDVTAQGTKMGRSGPVCNAADNLRNEIVPMSHGLLR